MKNFIRKLICKINGHEYSAPYFDNYSLCFCQRCGKEIADRTLDDLDSLPDDYERDLFMETMNYEQTR